LILLLKNLHLLKYNFVLQVIYLDPPQCTSVPILKSNLRKYQYFQYKMYLKQWSIRISMYRWIIYILMFSFTSGPSRISQFFRSTRVDERFLPKKYPLSIKALGAKLHRTLVSAKLALAFLLSHTPLVEKTDLEIWFAEKTGQSELKRVFPP
jgi:hypothetical protein